MVQQFLNANNTLYQVFRIFKIDGWFTQAIEKLGAKEICDYYGCQTIIKDNTMYYLVRECQYIEFTETT
jgi:hypothetical protein